MANQLCWSCAKACGKCSWSEYDRNEPVPGWTATPTKLLIGRDKSQTTGSYAITACPEFVLDRQDDGRGSGRDSVLDPEAVWIMICSGMTNREIAKAFDVPISTAGGWRKKLIKRHDLAIMIDQETP